MAALTQHPLVRVLRRFNRHGIAYEQLECGHLQAQPYVAVTGGANPVRQLSVTARRRCKTCKTPAQAPLFPPPLEFD